MSENYTLDVFTNTTLSAITTTTEDPDAGIDNSFFVVWNAIYAVNEQYFPQIV